MTFIDFILIDGAVDHDVRNIGVKHSHQVQCLNDFRTVLAAQGNVRFEFVLSVQIFDLFDNVRFDFGRITANLQQCEN